jgi:LuxR family maltose regulon positive regulatory protein
LSDLEAFSRTTYNHSILVPVLALQAILLDRQTDESAALARAAESLALAAVGRFIRPFVDLGSPMADLLGRLLTKTTEKNFIEQILEALASSEHPTGPNVSDASTAQGKHIPAKPLTERLTTREEEVLELLKQRLRTKEIAAELVVSPETVKTHLKSLYRKLGVNDRLEAVARSRELGLLA